MPYRLLQALQSLLEAWPRGIETAKHEDRATRGRKRSTNVFNSEATSVEGIVVTLYLFIVLKIGPEHNLHQEIPSETACSKVTYAGAGFAGLPGATYRLQPMTSHTTHT